MPPQKYRTTAPQLMTFIDTVARKKSMFGSAFAGPVLFGWTKGSMLQHHRLRSAFWVPVAAMSYSQDLIRSDRSAVRTEQTFFMLYLHIGVTRYKTGLGVG